MPSIFSRSNSSPKKEKSKSGKNGIAPSTINGPPYRGSGGVGEFGTIPNTQTSSRTLPSPTRPFSQSSLQTIRQDSTGPPDLPPKYSFLPTHIPIHTPSDNSIDSFNYSSDEGTSLRQYGVLGGIGKGVTLSIKDAGRVLRDVGAELGRRALDTPLLFSNQALELSQVRVKMLISAYMETLSGKRHGGKDTFLEDLRFAREYELAWLLRWALSRVVRIKEDTREKLHGVMEWEVYEEWRGRERAAGYPADAYPYLSALIPSEIYHTYLTPLLTLLTRFSAHSHLSGLTPHLLSSLFSPFIFNIPTSTPCLHSHTAFIRASSATEHLLLSHIRSSAQNHSVGVGDLPFRLKDWVRGYPRMIASDGEIARGSPRKGARVVRCELVRRDVRAYSKDLVVSAELWSGEFGTKWDTWERVVGKSKRGGTGDEVRPRFSTAWRRRMGVKDMLPLPSSSSGSDGRGGLRREMSYGKAEVPGSVRVDKGRRRIEGEGEDEARWGSLAGKEWSMFEEGGFSGEGKKEDFKSKLQFDLNESAKTSISARRQTMDWSEFASASGGFNRTDPQLTATLSFSPPISTQISDWPKEREDLRRRLHKSQKDATPFNHDTTPRYGVEAASGGEMGTRSDGNGRVYLEEGFVDWWADLGMGGGWIEREELTFREANWAIIEYKARPTRPEEAPLGNPLADPRTFELYFLFEERVPLEYQLAIANPTEKKTFATLFSPARKKRITSTHAPSPPSRAGWVDNDFDRMLLHREKTKKITLSHKDDQPSTAIWHLSQEHVPLSPKVVSRSKSNGNIRSAVNGRNGESERKGSLGQVQGGQGEEGRSNFFTKRDRMTRRGISKIDESGQGRGREEVLDFEIASASGVSSPDASPDEGGAGVRRKAGRDEDKWMDILIANGAKRMDRQDAAPPKLRGLGLEPMANGVVGLPASPHPTARLPSPAPPPGPPAKTPSPPHHTPSPPRLSPPTSQTPSNENGSPPHDTFQVPHDTSQPSNQIYQPPPHAPIPALGAPISPDPYSSPNHEHTHEWSGETAVSSDEGHTALVTPQRSNSGRRKPVPPLTEGENGYSEEILIPRERVEGSREILSPRPQRDTIHNIVDQYGHEDGDDDGEEGGGRDPRISIMSASTVASAEAVSPSREKTNTEEKVLVPPPPIFDLTPGREPSPARYKHGEPLHFVGEEEEEDEY